MNSSLDRRELLGWTAFLAASLTRSPLFSWTSVVVHESVAPATPLIGHEGPSGDPFALDELPIQGLAGGCSGSRSPRRRSR